MDLSYYCSPTKYGVGRKLNKGGHDKPDVTNMTQIKATMALKEWRIQRKANNDRVQLKCRKSFGTQTSSEDLKQSGVLNPQLCIMTDVQSSPLLVDHTFPVKELFLICIAREATGKGNETDNGQHNGNGNGRRDGNTTAVTMAMDGTMATQCPQWQWTV